MSLAFFSLICSLHHELHRVMPIVVCLITYQTLALPQAKDISGVVSDLHKADYQLCE